MKSCEMLTLLNVVEKVLEKDELKARSCWAKGVYAYAFDLIDDAVACIMSWSEDEPDKTYLLKDLKQLCLNGADNFKHYSYIGNSLCYDEDIAQRVCAPWELKKTQNGAKNPNAQENRLDVQARALYQAYRRIYTACKMALRFNYKCKGYQYE